MKITINILFWGTDEQRLLNTKLSWHNLKKFSQYAKEKGFEIEPFLFDFSEDHTLSEAKHIPYPNSSYKRSEKINKVIEYHGDYDGFFGVYDADVIFDPKDYDGLIYLLEKMKRDKFYVFKLNDISSTKGIDFDNLEIDFDNIEFSARNFEPDLGAVFFVDMKAVRENPFDERFICWGGEDNKIVQTLIEKGYKKIVYPIIPYHLPHVHALSELDKIQYQKQVQLLFENKNIK